MKKQFLMSAVINSILIEHFTDIALGSSPPRPDPVTRAFLEDRDHWLRLARPLSAQTISRLRQAITTVSVSGLHVSSFVSNPACPGGEEFVSLLTTNFEEFHLPPDTSVLQLVHGDWFLSGSQAAEGISLPPSNVFVRANPILVCSLCCNQSQQVTMHVAAAVQFLRFLAACRLPPRTAHSVELDLKISRAEDQSSLDRIQRSIDVLTTSFIDGRPSSPKESSVREMLPS